MDLKNQGNDPNTSPNILPKRKRGRPRKDQSQTPSGIQKVDHIHGQGGFVQTPKFTMTDGNHSHQQASPQQNDAAMVGQPVNGKVESTFEAGYFVSIKIGNSDTILRGVVLKPGHCFPASIGKDLGPQIEMASNAVPFSAGLHTPVQSGSRRGKGQTRPRKETHGSSSGNDLVKLLGDRGRLVPVVLKPANLSSEVAPDIGSLPALSKPAHLATSKSASVNQTQLKQVEKKDDDPPLTEKASKVQLSVDKLPVFQERKKLHNDVVEELVPALSKPAHLATSKSASVNQTQLKQMEKKDDDPPLTEKTSKVQLSVAKLPVFQERKKLHNDVVEELVTDVAKMVKISSWSNEMQSENGQPCGAFADEQMGDWSKPFLVKPLHGMHSGPFNQFPLVPMSFGYGRPGKMTELLLAMQGSVICKQAADVQNRGFSWH